VTYLQAIVIALVQGVTELFPVSSLGHSVLLPAWLGGTWQTMVTQSSQQDSGSSWYLAYIVALHVATALALLWFFRADWARIIRGFFRSLGPSLRARRLVARDTDEKLAWMVVLATIPVGLTGVVFEHTFRTLFAKPAAAAALLFVNGLILLGAELLRRRSGRRGTAAAGLVPEVTAAAALAASGTAAAGATAGTAALPDAQRARLQPPRGARGGRAAGEIDAAEQSDGRIAQLSYGNALIVGSLQIAALFAGISRSGITMAGGLWRGLDHEDAARFAFLLATPVILAAGVLKGPDLLGKTAAHIHGQVLVGFLVCGTAAYLSVRFLVRWFQTRTLTPFAIYCLVVGAASIARFAF